MSRPPRFVIARAAIDAATVRLGGAELHHLRDVQRLVTGSELSLIDETDQIYGGRIERFDPDYAVIAVTPIARGAVASPELILAAGLTKGPRMDLLVEKAAELGASELIPLLTTRSVMRDVGTQRLERWRRITIAAAKQSLAAQRMRIRTPITVAAMVRDLPPDTLAVVCVMDASPLGTIIRETCPRRILLACGAEGGFEADEMALIRDAGFREAALGANRLRSETAALAALSIAAGAIHELSHEVARRS
jgi:16S rRNA (uracil1498-N3)-methyltransferase